MGYKIEIKNLSYKPDPESQRGVLNDLSLSINEGEFVSIFGKNGHGKTSLMHAIVGELDTKSGNVTGEVSIHNIPIKSSVNRLMEGVSIVHQFVEYDLIEDLSIGLNIEMRLFNSPKKKSLGIFRSNDFIVRTNTALAKFFSDANVKINLNHLVRSLSGGQRQLLNILIALDLEHEINSQCELLILDEHLTGLDISIRKKAMNFIMEKVNRNSSDKKSNITTLMVAHDFDYSLLYADRILILNNGSIVSELKKEESGWNIENIISLIEGNK